MKINECKEKMQPDYANSARITEVAVEGYDVAGVS